MLPWLLSTVEQLLNRALQVDPESRERLTDFDGRSLSLHIEDWQETIVVRIAGQSVQLSGPGEQTEDLAITASSLAFVKLSQDPQTLFSPAIRIHGDVQFAKQLQDWLEGFDFDWEQQLARVTGDTLAHPLAEGLRQTSRWLKSSSQSLQLDIAEYLREESRLLPDQSEVNQFLQGVDQLRSDLDRLEARLQRLQGRK